MNVTGMIDVTGVPLKSLIAAAYGLSVPQGLGILHFKPGSLSDEEVDEILRMGTPRIPVSMDYVKGRACKFTVFANDGKHYINNRWYDHSDVVLGVLLAEVGLSESLIEDARRAAAA